MSYDAVDEPEPDDNEDAPSNQPNMDKVEYEVAMETIAKMFRDLRKTGLSKDEAASIVAAMVKGESL